LQYLFVVCGRPKHWWSDNGPEFVAEVVVRWLKQADVGTLFIARAVLGRMDTSNRSRGRRVYH
jgi:hypothetical protein